MVGDSGNKLVKKLDGTVSLIEELDNTPADQNPVNAGSYSYTGFAMRNDFVRKETVESDARIVVSLRKMMQI